MPTCLCGKTFALKRTAGKKQIFCSHKCRRNSYDRVANSTLGQTVKCAVCPNTFVKKKHHQRFCSQGCYKGAWVVENREAHNTRHRARRKEQPEWYREKEPQYYLSYRTKQEEKRPWRYVFQSRRLEARKKNIPFDLTDEWCASRWTGRCELTNIEFIKNPAGSRGPYPFSCSLDRIEPELGYILENCRFILWGCNALKGCGTDEDMFAIAKAITNP